MGTVMRYLTGLVKIKTQTVHRRTVRTVPRPRPGQVQAQLGHGQGQGEGKARPRLHNYYYQTLRKCLILRTILAISRPRPRPRHLADPTPSLGNGTIRFMHQKNKRPLDLAKTPILAMNNIKYLCRACRCIQTSTQIG